MSEPTRRIQRESGPELLGAHSGKGASAALEIAELRAELDARDKTIAVLINRVEGYFEKRSSAFAVLEQNISLEQTVRRRTRELEESHAELSRTLLELKLAQGQLLETKKLEAVGQLAAGIAHEINTPVQYITDNTTFLSDAFQKLMAALDSALMTARELAGDGAGKESLEQLERGLRGGRLDWMRSQIPRALEQSLEGLNRVRSIVSAMKEFSHPSGSMKQLVDLHAAIRSTITVARHEWKYVAEVKTSFAADLPLVPCLRDEFNQVILNLIVNAAHAISEKPERPEDEKGVISIETEQVGREIEIRIRDDGGGIPAHVQARVYDPFFTTKPVGRGTGQGLSIARSVVVDKHGGTLRFETRQGEGTCFFIRLPLAESASQGAASEQGTT